MEKLYDPHGDIEMAVKKLCSNADDSFIDKIWLSIYMFFRWKIIHPIKCLLPGPDRFYARLKKLDRRKVKCYEAWNLGDYFAAWILPLLKELRKQNIELGFGYSTEYSICKNCKNLDNWHECDHLEDGEAAKNWIADLDKVILAFEYYLRDEEDIAYLLFSKKAEDQEKYKQIIKERGEIIREGSELFAKNWRSYWT